MTLAQAVVIIIGAVTLAIVATILILVVAFVIRVIAIWIVASIQTYKKSRRKKHDPVQENKEFLRDIENVMEINYNLSYREAEEIAKYIRRKTQERDK
jgi:uncharacterized membrane protein YhiD involved in acid resistance